GLVSNLSRPTDNMTGVSYFGGPELVTKRLGLLHECIPEATPIAALLDPNYVEVEAELREAESAARELKQKMLVVKAGNDADFHASFSSMAQAGVSGVLVGGGGFFNSQRRQLVTLAARHAMFAIYNLREFVEVGGLMSYGGSTADAYRRAGIYVGRIIKGTKPADLPVELPTKFELIINVATAKGLGLEIPPMLLARRRGDRIGPDHRSHLLTRGMRPSTSGAGRSTSSARVRSWVMPQPAGASPSSRGLAVFSGT
ncbi:MAG: ABC transporter substrate-binding protein, partial [Pseudolabrys sp.]